MSQRMSGMESLWPGRVTQVIDPHYFWMQLGTRESLTRFEKLQRDMQEYGRLHFKSLSEADPLEYGHVVLVDTGDSGALRFKRGQVARITSGNSVDIFYVDYGNTELTTRDKIMSFMPDLFKTCMPQAVRCSLAGVRPISKNWTTRGTRTFQTATDSPLMYTLVLHGEPGYCEVSLYPSESEEARSIAHVLLEEEVAMCKDGEEVPEYVRDIPDFMASYMSRVYSDKMKTSDGSQMSPKQETIAMENSNSLQLPAHTASPGTSPPSNGPTSDKYIPPGRKYQDKSPRSPGSQFEGSPGSHSSISSSPGQAQAGAPKTPHSAPVVDFFPFDNVSTYPPTPVSPVKSPGRSSNASGSQESYFSRSPSKYDHHDSYRAHQANGQAYRGRSVEGYYDETSDRGYYSRNSNERNYKRPSEHHHNHHHHDRSRFAANFDNLPSSATGDVSGKVTAAANLEPHYLNKMSERNGQHASGDSSQHSPSSGPSRYMTSPSRPIQNPANATAPFYPPKSVMDMVDPASSQPINLTTPQYYYSKTTPPDNYNKHSKDLMPPGFYQSPNTSSPGNQPDQYSPAAGDSYAYMGKYPYEPEASGSPAAVYRTDGQYPAGDYGYGYPDIEPGHRQQQYKQQYYSPEDSKAGYYREAHAGDFDHHSVPPGYSQQANRYSEGSKPRPRNENNSNTHTRPPRPHVTMPSNSTPTKSAADPYSQQKVSPASPDSPAIAGFNLSDIDHTQFASADAFHARMHQEKLQALQEEAEDIAVESQEQSRLAQMARYGGGPSGDGHDLQQLIDHDVFDQISEDISFASRENEELKNSPIKHYRDPPVQERPSKLEGMPASYVADIDFTEAVKEALDFAKTDGIENAKALLDSVVESLRTAKVEKQLFDVLLMLLAKAVQNYDLCHEVVMATIDRLNTEMEIKEPLTRALKRQQDLCVQVPVRKIVLHQQFSRIMAGLYNLAQGWSDSNATIQDTILVTVEKWILFNNKGSQIGQTDKENVFLDCFVAFWEVSGSQLLQHNDSFRSRLLEDVKQKLLHEHVTRPIRERLLEILLESFMGGANVRVRKEDAFTQTPRKTMIPSSCQVKPAAREISTMTVGRDLTDDFSSYDHDDSRWYSATDFTSPEVSLSLRPMGQRSKAPHLSSTPEDTARHHRSKLGSSVAEISLNCAKSVEQSLNSSTTDADFVTPNTSIIRDKANSPADNSHSKPSSEALKHSVCDSDSAKKDLEVNSPVRSGVARASQTSRNTTGDKKTVCETKSATGKTIVDWFDYQPDVETTNSSAKATGAKSVVEENLKQVKKSVDSLSLNSIEEKYSVIAKGKSVAEKVGNSAKSRKKEKKAAKSNQTSSKVGQGTSALEGKAKAVEVSVNVSDSLPEVAEAVDVDDSVKDWWGADDDLESKNKHVHPPRHGACEIHVDASPDVIIEDEFIEEVNDKDSCEASVSDEPAGAQAEAPGSLSESPSPLSQSDDAVKHTQSTDLSQDDLISDAKGDESGAKRAVNDMYGFSEEMSDDNWESDNADDFTADGLMDNGILPNIALVSEDKGAKGESVSNVTGNEDTDHYSRNFPKSNLADFIRPVLEDSPSPEPVSRWKPKRRICLTCHDEGHTTENCPKGILLL